MTPAPQSMWCFHAKLDLGAAGREEEGKEKVCSSCSCCKQFYFRQAVTASLVPRPPPVRRPFNRDVMRGQLRGETESGLGTRQQLVVQYTLSAWQHTYSPIVPSRNCNSNVRLDEGLSLCCYCHVISTGAWRKDSHCAWFNTLASWCIGEEI